MARSRIGSQEGFTLVEIMVAMTVLLVGVLGTVTMIDGANAVSSQNKSREGGTALARTVLEIARGIPYKDLTADRVLAELADREGFADAAGGVAGHQVSSRGFTYTVAPVVCSMDDPKDNLGDHDEEAVFCSDSDALAVGATAVDRNADDYRRMRVALTWNPSPQRTDSVTQTGIVTNPVGGLGPSVTSLTPDTPSTVTITSALTTTASYDLTTSAVPLEVSWSIDGARQGAATGSGTDWTFTWNLGATDAPTFVDCTYVVQAEAFDDKGRAGAPRALTVTLNRRAPFAPVNFEGGRNLNAAGPHVDLQWSPNQECDVQKYRVYRGTSSGSITTQVCELTREEPTECVDQTAPGGVTLYYQVVALDTAPGGSDREGSRSATLTVAPETANAGPPDTPATFSVCTGGNPACTDIDGNSTPSGLPVLSWTDSTDSDGIGFYRVYRDGNTYADRLDVLFEVPGKPLVFIDDTATGSHSYRVSAVDTLFGESALTGAVSWP